MGLFDSNSSTSNFNQTNNIKKDLVIGNGSQGFSADNGGSVNVNMLDGGAIANSFTFADRTASGAFDLVKANDVQQGKNYADLLHSTSAVFDSLIGASNNNMAGILNGVASTQNFIASTQATAKGTIDSRTMMMIGLGLAAVLGLAIWRK